MLEESKRLRSYVEFQHRMLGRGRGVVEEIALMLRECRYSVFDTMQQSMGRTIKMGLAVCAEAEQELKRIMQEIAVVDKERLYDLNKGLKATEKQV